MIPITRIPYKQLRGYYLIEVMGTDWFTWWRPIDDIRIIIKRNIQQ
jgi:hypothetical protein